MHPIRLSTACAAWSLGTLLTGCVTLTGNGSSGFSLALNGSNPGGTAEAAAPETPQGTRQAPVSSGGGAAVPTASCTLHEAKLSFPTEYQGSDLALADFNGDGKLDVAVAANTDGNKKPATVRVYLGKGDGTFGDALVTAFPVPALWTAAAAAADFNGDGHMDLVLGDTTNPAHNDLTYVLLYGKGDGSFEKPVLAQKAGASQFYNPRAADVNGDKKADLVVSAQLEIEGGSQWIVALNGNARDKLGRPLRIGNAGNREIARELAYRDQFQWELADVDGDGAVELVAPPIGFAAVDRDRPNNTGDGNYGVCVVKISRAGKFQDPACYGSKSEYAPEAVALADFTGDGQLDIATGPKSHSYLDSTHGLYVHLNGGQGRFSQVPVRADDPSQSDITNFWALHAADVTGDGKADIVMLGRGAKGPAALVLTGRGDGSFGGTRLALMHYDSGSAPVVRFGGFKGTGTLGIALYSWSGVDNAVSVFSGECGK